MIRFSCPQCGAKIQAADTAAGQPRPCPLCGDILRIPPAPGAQNVSRGARGRPRRKLGMLCLGIVGACLAVVHLTAEPIGKLLHWRIANREGLSGGAGALLLLICLAALIYVIGSAPGRIARSRRHPQAEAITVCGWLGLFLTGGLLWVLAIIWAHTNPTGASQIRRGPPAGSTAAGPASGWAAIRRVLNSPPRMRTAVPAVAALLACFAGTIYMLDRQAGASYRRMMEKYPDTPAPGIYPFLSDNLADSLAPGRIVVTLDDYNCIHPGMSYSQVAAIIGQDGVEISSGRFEGVAGVMPSITTVMYEWINGDGGNMNAMFQNDRLINKAQFGLR